MDLGLLSQLSRCLDLPKVYCYESVSKDLSQLTSVELNGVDLLIIENLLSKCIEANLQEICTFFSPTNAFTNPYILLIQLSYPWLTQCYKIWNSI